MSIWKKIFGIEAKEKAEREKHKEELNIQRKLELANLQPMIGNINNQIKHSVNEAEKNSLREERIKIYNRIEELKRLIR